MNKTSIHTSSLLLLSFALLVSLFNHFFMLSSHEFQAEEAEPIFNAISFLTTLNRFEDLFTLFDASLGRFGILIEIPALFFGENKEFALRAPHALLGAISVIPIFFIGREIKSSKTGSYAAMLFAVSGICMIQRTATGYGADIFYQLCSLYYFIKYLKYGDSGKRFLIFFLITLIHEFANIIFFIPVLTLLIVYGEGGIVTFWEKHLKWIIFVFLAYAVYFLLWIWGTGLDSFIDSLNPGIKFNVDEFWHAVDVYHGGPFVSFVLTLAIIGFLFVFKRKNWIYIAYLLWILFPFLYVSFFTQHPITEVSTFLPYLFLLSGYGIDSMFKKRIFRVLCTCFIIPFGEFHTLELLKYPGDTDHGPQVTMGWKTAGYWLRENSKPNDHFMTDMNRFVAKYYIGRPHVDYSTSAAMNVKYAIIGKEQTLEPDGFVKVASVDCNQKESLKIYSREVILSDESSEQEGKPVRVLVKFLCGHHKESFDKNYAGVKGFLPYLESSGE
jgi:4-amino-4-deoxy-L-arabinose transferase-like glycosyltransferase